MRFLPHTDEDIALMLNLVEAKSLDGLFSTVLRFHIDTNLVGYILLWSSVVLAYYSAATYSIDVAKRVFASEE